MISVAAIITAIQAQRVHLGDKQVKPGRCCVKRCNKRFDGTPKPGDRKLWKSPVSSAISYGRVLWIRTKRGFNNRGAVCHRCAVEIRARVNLISERMFA